MVEQCEGWVVQERGEVGVVRAVEGLVEKGWYSTQFIQQGFDHCNYVGVVDKEEVFLISVYEMVVSGESYMTCLLRTVKVCRYWCGVIRRVSFCVRYSVLLQV